MLRYEIESMMMLIITIIVTITIQHAIPSMLSAMFCITHMKPRSGFERVFKPGLSPLFIFLKLLLSLALKSLCRIYHVSV